MTPQRSRREFDAGSIVEIARHQPRTTPAMRGALARRGSRGAGLHYAQAEGGGDRIRVVRSHVAHSSMRTDGPTPTLVVGDEQCLTARHNRRHLQTPQAPRFAHISRPTSL